jgi:hypothetical protein
MDGETNYEYIKDFDYFIVRLDSMKNGSGTVGSVDRVTVHYGSGQWIFCMSSVYLFVCIGFDLAQ